MSKTVIFLFFLLTSIVCSSQNDTLYLESDCVVLNEQHFNKIDNGGLKTGNWIDYQIDYLKIPIEVWNSSGEGFHEQATIYTKFRPLKENEHNGLKIIIKEKVDTIGNDLHYDIEYDEIKNRISPDLYCILSVGNYKCDLKQSIWEYFYCSGKSKKKIDYVNGRPKSNFEIFRENGTLMIGLIMKNDSIWEVNKYNESEVLIETISDKLERFKGLY